MPGETGFWKGKRVFITGHTGFKGSWLSLWLTNLGATVRGYALPPITTPNAFDALGLAEMLDHVVGDVRDESHLATALADHEPDVVFHLAAQPLVLESYNAPVVTYATNVMGTVHLLEAVRRSSSVRAVVVVTTDKCYENREWVWGYREHDRLGGHDPYSSSKACAEFVASAYRHSFFAKTANVPVAISSGRAGNVIGGGDWSADRLVPDSVRSLIRGEAVGVRRPWSTRPWQHVLEPLSGYMRLAEASCEDPRGYAEAWNFGPRDSDITTVRQLMDMMVVEWGGGASWLDISKGLTGPHEASLLKLDTSKAASALGWTPRWNLAESVRNTVSWYKNFYAGVTGKRLREYSSSQIAEYETARIRG
ncbi:MAG: CDP-glucose 4,6-dehydratase [Gemmatimonadaceae bacterium]